MKGTKRTKKDSVEVEEGGDGREELSGNRRIREDNNLGKGEKEMRVWQCCDVLSVLPSCSWLFAGIDIDFNLANSVYVCIPSTEVKQSHEKVTFFSLGSIDVYVSETGKDNEAEGI